jgi:hypothetical protein
MVQKKDTADADFGNVMGTENEFTNNPDATSACGAPGDRLEKRRWRTALHRGIADKAQAFTGVLRRA